MTSSWVLLAACEALLAAKRGHWPHRAGFSGHGKWQGCGGFSRPEMRAGSKAEACSQLCLVPEASTGLGCVLW